MGPQLFHRLVMRGSHGLRLDVEQFGDLGHLHLAAIEQLDHERLPLGPGYVAVGKRDVEILGHGAIVEQVVLLKETLIPTLEMYLEGT